MSQLVLKHPDLKHEDLKFNTVEVHAGEPRDMYGALIPPIYQTSTFYFDSTDDAVKACDDYAESFAYSRITNPSVDYLEQKLAALEHGKGAVAYASGMGAVSGAIFALLKSGDHAIFTKAKYSGTEDVTSDWLPRFGIAHDTFDAADLSQLEGLIKPNTKLIYVESPANPTMVLVDIAAVVEIAHKHGVWMHTDAVQAVGAIPVDVKELGVDMLSMSAHKFNGPKGMGALYCRKGIWPQNLIDGGSQEARHRAGTENVAGIAGMGKALEMATEHLEERMAHEKELRDYVIDRILKNIPEARLNGGLEHRLPGNANISFPGLEGETILLDLDMHGICASTGSACNSDSLDPSHVLLSIGVPEEIGHGSMRFTFGPQNTMEEAKYLCDVLEEVIPRRRAMSCMWLQGQNTARHFSLKGEN